MRRFPHSDGELYESKRQLIRNHQQYPLERPAIAPNDFAYRRHIAEIIANNIINREEGNRQNVEQNRRRQPLLVKAMIVSLIIMLAAKTMDPQCSEPIERGCLQDYMLFNCSNKLLSPTSHTQKKCKQLELCMNSPHIYFEQIKEKEWGQKIKDFREYLHWLKEQLFWIFGILFSILFTIWWSKT